VLLKQLYEQRQAQSADRTPSGSPNTSSHITWTVTRPYTCSTCTKLRSIDEDVFLENKELK
jgi:hypothetical protein